MCCNCGRALDNCFGSLQITFHVSALLTLAAAILVYLLSTVVDVELPWGNRLDRWMYLGTLALTISYAANTGQMLLLRLTRHLLENTLYIRTYFALRSVISSISVSAVIIVLQYTWHTKLTFGEETDRHIQRLFRVALVLVCVDIYRKIYIQHTVLRLNGAHYRERLATFKFRSQALTAVLQNRPVAVLRRRPSMTEASDLREKTVMFPDIVFDNTTPLTVLLAEFLSNKWQDDLFTR